MLKLVLSTSQVVILAFLATFIFEIQSSTILSVSALLGTVIGFGLAVVIGNIFAGFYLITTRPFGIGDFILVGSTEGIVLEIGLNYTKILQLDSTIVLIPNKKLLDANLVNCSIKLSDLETRAKMGHEIDYDKIKSQLNDLDKKNDKLTTEMTEELLGGRKFTRYPFTLQLKVNVVTPEIPLSAVNERMKLVCDRWEEKLGFRPKYYYGKNIFRQDMRVIMIVNEPMEIHEKQGLFMEDLYETVFQEIHIGGDKQ
ncbi:MAG: mechanosensitive ion channel domain-containing protein [Candidatus Kariarchaeaceae archaeon]